MGGGVTWFPHPGQTHPDLISRDAPRGGGEGAEAVNQRSPILSLLQHAALGQPWWPCSLFIQRHWNPDPTWLSTWLNPKQAIWKSILKTNGRKGRRPIYLSPLPRAIPGWQHPACFLGARGKSSPSQKHLVSPRHRLHPPCKSSSPSTVQKGPGD